MTDTISYLRTFSRKVDEADARLQKLEEVIRYDKQVGLVMRGPIFYSGNLYPAENYKSNIGSPQNFINNLYLSGKIVYPDALDFGVNNDFCIDRMGKIGFHCKHNLDGVTIKGLPSFTIQNATYLGENTLLFQIGDGTMQEFVSKQDILLINNIPYQIVYVSRDKLTIESLDGSNVHLEVNATYDMSVYNNLLGIVGAKDEQLLKMNAFGDIFYKTQNRNAEINIGGNVHFEKDVCVKKLATEKLEVENAEIVANLNAEFLCGKKGPLNGDLVSTKDKQQLWNKSFGDELVMHYNRILDVGDPLYDMDAVNKRYVDRYLSGIKIGTPVSCASVENLDADYEKGEHLLHLRAPENLNSNLLQSAFDGYNLQVNERCLLLHQHMEWQNGVYLVVSDGVESGRVVLQRVGDFNEKKSVEQLRAYYIFVKNGQKYGNTGMVFEYLEDFVWNETPVRFNIFSRTENYGVEQGIKKIGNNFTLNVNSNQFSFVDKKLQITEGAITNKLLENSSLTIVPDGGIDLEKCVVKLGENVKIGLKINRKQFQFGKNGELQLANFKIGEDKKLGPTIRATGSLENVFQLEPPSNFEVVMQYSDDFLEKERDMVVQYYICSVDGKGRETQVVKSDEFNFTDDAKSVFSNLDWQIVTGCEGYIVYRRINTVYSCVKLTQMETTMLDVLVPRSFTKIDWRASDAPPEVNRTVVVINHFGNEDNFITSGSLGIGTVKPNGCLHIVANEINNEKVGLQIEGNEKTVEMLKLHRRGMKNVVIKGETGEGMCKMEMGKNIKFVVEDDGVLFLGRDDGAEDNNINERIGSDDYVVQVTDGSLYCNGEVMVGQSFATFNSKLGNNAAILKTGCVSTSIGNQVGFMWEGEQLMAVPFNDGNVLTRKKVQVKNFTIDHPLYKEKYLVHACLEGPTADVMYKGYGHIAAGNDQVDIVLPQYYEQLVVEGSGVVTLTIKGRPIARIGGEVLKDRIRVYLDTNYGEDVGFYWQLVAERKGTSFEVEPKKEDVEVKSWGPYTWI